MGYFSRRYKPRKYIIQVGKIFQSAIKENKIGGGHQSHVEWNFSIVCYIISSLDFLDHDDWIR